MTPAEGTLHVSETADELTDAATSFLVARATATSGRFVLCLSGGSTPKALYTRLVSRPLPWDRTVFVFGDERFVPPDHKDSNARMVREAMLTHVSVPPANVHEIPTVGLTPDEAARRYAETLHTLNGGPALDPARPLLDVTLLGLGEDGHTASLLPNEPALDESSAWVAAVAHGRPETRITLTYPALNSSRCVMFLVQGEAKRAILHRVLAGEPGLPASRLRPVGDIHWFVDRAAIGDRI